MVQTFFAEVNADATLEEKYKLDAVITVVDAKYIIQRLDETKGTEAEQQVCFADKIILNKMVSQETKPSNPAELPRVGSKLTPIRTGPRPERR